MSHTEGKLEYQERSDAYTHIIRGPRGRMIAYTPQGSDGTDEANARRLVACWNACSSYDTQHLETECLDKRERWEIMVDLQDFEKRSWADRERIATLEKERDELVEALSLWMHFFGGDHEDAIMTIAEDGSTLTEPQEVTARILARYQEAK